MTVKEKIIRQTLSKIDKRLSQIKELQDARPVSAIFELRQKAHEIMETYKGDYNKIAEAIEPLAKEEKKQRAIFEKQQGVKLCDEQLKLESEKHDLMNELFFIQRK